MNVVVQYFTHIVKAAKGRNRSRNRTKIKIFWHNAVYVTGSAVHSWRRDQTTRRAVAWVSW